MFELAPNLIPLKLKSSAKDADDSQQQISDYKHNDCCMIQNFIVPYLMLMNIEPKKVQIPTIHA